MSEPNQPRDFNFPKRSFGKKNPELRSFNAQWFKLHSWLHYNEVYILIHTNAEKQRSQTKCLVNEFE